MSNENSMGLEGELSHFRATLAKVLSVQVVGLLGPDVNAEITYKNGKFMISTQVVPRPRNPARKLTQAEMRALLTALRGGVYPPGPEVDPTALQAFIDLLAKAVNDAPLGQFERARFVSITKDASGTLEAQLGLGIDTLGTVRDTKGKITFEQHVVGGPGGKVRPMSRSDKAALAAALAKFIASTVPRPDPLWDQLLADLEAKSRH